MGAALASGGARRKAGITWARKPRETHGGYGFRRGRPAPAPTDGLALPEDSCCLASARVGDAREESAAIPPMPWRG